jgi:NAD/NADP transhydrogenase alpha subunit
MGMVLSCMSVLRHRPLSKHLGEVHATVDLGEIHLAAASTNRGLAMIVTGCDIRSLKRQRSKQLGKIAKKQS